MICAYSKEEIEAIRNRFLAEKWTKSGILSDDEKKAIIEQNPIKLYHPNFAFQVLFFLGAIVSVSGLVGIFMIPMIEMMDDAPSSFFFFFGGLLIFLNEVFFLKTKRHYRSGLLQGVYYMAIAYILAGIGIFFEDVNAVFYFSAFVLFLLVSLRYLDRFAMVLSLLSVNILVFFVFENLEFAIPFILAFLNAGTFIIFHYLKDEKSLSDWKEIIHILMYTSLFLAGLFLNVFIVQEGANEFLRMSGDIPLKWLFVLTSILIPATYLYIGLVKRNRIMLRVGMVLIFLGLAGIKYYYSSGHTEFTLTFTGLLVFFLSIYIIRKFKIGIKGITSKKIEGKGSALLTVLMAAHAERDVQIDTTETTDFGGGSFGGGGAGSDF